MATLEAEVDADVDLFDISHFALGVPALAADGVVLSDILSEVSGVTIRERVDVLETFAPQMRYAVALVDAVQMADLLKNGYPVVATDGLTMADLTRITLGGTVIERLNLLEQWKPNGIYARNILDVVRLSDLLARMVSADINETLGIADILTPRLRAGVKLQEALDVTASITPKFILAAVARDTVELSTTELLNTIFSGKILERVELSGAYISPDGNFTTWATNTRTGAVTEYENFAFNSFAMNGGKYLGASRDGLFELNGDDDDGEDIIARIRGGYMQFGGVRQSRLKAVYIATRGEGDFILRIETAEGQLYDYATTTRDMRTTKVHMGKGQRARYFAFELISAGQDFDLESLEFVPIVVQRRV